jgi:hypothetical protein
MDPLEFAEGSHERFQIRRLYFRNDKKPHPELRHAALWVLHNCVAHPILAVSPGPMAAEFHELTSQWLRNQHRDHSAGRGRWLLIRKMPVVPPEKRAAWVLHNVVAHVAIGLAPCKATFALHDKTAEAMDVEGWV